MTASAEAIQVGSAEDPDALGRLASDFDRWGLAPEAEIARLRARTIRVRQLIVQGQMTAGGTRRREQGRRPGR